MNAHELLAEFESFQAELKSFVLRMTASVQDAEDIVLETELSEERAALAVLDEASTQPR